MSCQSAICLEDNNGRLVETLLGWRPARPRIVTPRSKSSNDVDRDRRKVISAQFTLGLWTINDALSDVCALVIRLDTMLRQ